MALIITLILLGIILLCIELLLIPGFGVTGILGILSLVGGVVLAYYNYGTTAGHIVLAITILIGVLFVWYALRAKTWKRLSLHENITSRAIEMAADKGLQAGMQGIAITRLAPVGTVKINDTYIEATTYEGIINPQQKIEIIKIDGAKITVKSV